MPINKIPGSFKSPEIRRWRVMEVVSKTGARSRHIWGHDVANDAGRASSGIKEFDLEAMTATTHSGRVYKLVGAPGKARSGEKAWQGWCQVNGVVSAVDVTAEYFDVDQLFAKHGHADNQ
jgi:hypothetical protein